MSISNEPGFFKRAISKLAWMMGYRKPMFKRIVPHTAQPGDLIDGNLLLKGEPARVTHSFNDMRGSCFVSVEGVEFTYATKRKRRGVSRHKLVHIPTGAILFIEEESFQTLFKRKEA